MVGIVAVLHHSVAYVSQSDFSIQIYCYIFTYLMANSADPDQLASSEAN